MSFAEDRIKSRRLFVLRLLVEARKEANESVLFGQMKKGGFSLDTRDDVRKDLDHLRTRRCTTEEWLHPEVCVVKLTQRGEDAAYGRIEVDGVEASIWDR